MGSFKNLKKNLYALPMSVRLLHSILAYKIIDEGRGVDEQIVTDSEIEQFIYKADSIIDAYLAYLGSGALANETAYYEGPTYVVQTQNVFILEGVTVGVDAITEQWKIVFSDSDAFTVYGNFSGNQGTGDITTDFTSTNGDLAIASEDWRRTTDDDTIQFSDGDTIFVGVFKTNPTVKHISSLLAAGLLVDAKYTESEAMQSGWGKAYYKRAMDLLEKLADPDSEISLDGTTSANVEEYDAVEYNITFTGEDETEYREITDDSLPW